ncbi:hypothetical protein MKW98_003866 [Papaver atlanticum]|uniref:DUF7794 domain-containing protein n=1 Tax=Papaver atlanticum TaxID=357466 RepID=A0AAD4XCB4_9MAGN|nr:hypothetical protein MKW98_003866 [Papaver atlanticum]
MKKLFNQALLEQYGPDGVAQQGMELFQMTLEMIFDPLQRAYQGQIVGVISRLLEEKASTAIPTLIVEILLVRRTLAWITGIILLISTLPLGMSFAVVVAQMFFLVNMPNHKRYPSLFEREIDQVQGSAKSSTCNEDPNF